MLESELSETKGSLRELAVAANTLRFARAASFERIRGRLAPAISSPQSPRALQISAEAPLCRIRRRGLPEASSPSENPNVSDQILSVQRIRLTRA